MSHPHVSVIIPSALRTAPDGRLWLERAIRSAQAQTLPPKEIIVGLDPGEYLPGCIMALATEALPIRQANGEVRGHQSACNAAAGRASCPLLSFLEDDDLWLPNHLETLAFVLDNAGVQFVSTSQAEVDAAGVPNGKVFDFPTASGWLMTRLAWMQTRWHCPRRGLLPGFDTAYKITHDNDFLARLNAANIPRAHVICEPPAAEERPHLTLIARHARIIRVDSLAGPTVRRTVHPDSVLAGTEVDEKKRVGMALEYAWLARRYGDVAETW